MTHAGQDQFGMPSDVEIVGPITISGTVSVTEVAPTTVKNGQVTIAVTGTAVPLTGAPDLIQVVTVTALSSNSASVFVGDSGVTTANGYELLPGASVAIAINDLGKVFINGTNPDGVGFVASL